ncbi:hypothetical protein TWF970_002399 [Orbilia oligospora]|uniref:CBM1 domain-containing protein n=1 Tax=Orbilia oligospora TaxID=2813651 RepID=A0A7C8VJ22_ORBOL|nr:hypothetical protein TWF970_002399 [Orbilia oligospora]
MFSLLRLFLTILYLSVFTAALPSTRQSPLSSPSANPPTGNTICKEDNLPCGTTCYDPTEADCDPQFLTLTRFRESIPPPPPPPPVFPKQINQPSRNVRYVHAEIPPPS